MSDRLLVLCRGEQLIQAQLPRRVGERLAAADANGEGVTDGEGVVCDVMEDFVQGKIGEEDEGLPLPMGGVLLVRQQADRAASTAFRSRPAGAVAALALDQGRTSDDRPADVPEGAAGAGEFEVVWSHNSSSFAVAYLSGQMAALRVPPRCVFSRLAGGAGSRGAGVPAQQRHLPSSEVCTTSAAVT